MIRLYVNLSVDVSGCIRTLTLTLTPTLTLKLFDSPATVSLFTVFLSSFQHVSRALMYVVLNADLYYHI